jgi:hypothetical protein
MNSTARARAYLAKLPPAIAGQGGHAATFAAACRLREFGLSEGDALAILSEWNLTHCQPQWSERDLRHKLADAFRVTSPKEDFTASSPRQEWRLRPQSSRTIPGPASPRGIAVEPAENPSVNTAGTQSKRPISNPNASFFPLSTSQAHFSTLATLRGLSVEGVRLAAERGLLRFGMFRTRLAWFILDTSQRVIQARRLDGRPWAPSFSSAPRKWALTGVKAWTLPGSQAAWPVGIGEARDFANVALCEGGPDLLAACAFILAEGRERDVTPVTMLGGCARIHPDALPMFAGKRVRIFAHLDETGDTAANRWAEQLADAGATVDAFSLASLRRSDGEPVKDLCDLAAINADDFETHRCLWELFNYARPT